MAIRMFAVPFDARQESFHDEELQKFLLNKQVKTIRPEFFHQNGRAYWTIFIEYELVLKDAPRNANALDAPQRLLYQRFREWRKEKAESEGIPVFLIATNRELLDLVKSAPRTLEALRQIHGFGKKKSDKYGQEILTIISAFYEKKAA